MALIPLISLALKGFAAFWSLVTFVVAAALQSKLTDYGRNHTGLSAANAIIAAGVFAFIYFLAALFFIFVRPDNIFVSVLVDTVIIGFLFILALGGTAAESQYAGDFSDCDADVCNLGSGLLGVAWVFTLLLLGILLFEVIYTLIHFGGSLETWKTPFNQLLQYGSGRHSTAGVSSGGDVPRPVAMGTVGGGHAPATSVGTATRQDGAIV